jgi:hypothetical protein
MAVLSVRQVADHAQTSDRTVRRWIAEGKLATERTVDDWTVTTTTWTSCWPSVRPSATGTHSSPGRPTNGHVDGHMAVIPVAMLEELQAKAELNAYWQGRAMAAQERISQLEALPEPASTPFETFLV